MGLATLTNNAVSKILDTTMSTDMLKISYFKIGDSIITPNPAMEDITDLIYTGTPSQLSYQRIDNNTLKFKIILDSSIGDFSIGNIGIFDEDDDMFCIGSPSQLIEKKKDIYGEQIGNRRAIFLFVTLSGIADKVNFELIQMDGASIPVLDNETLLPDVNTSEYSTYLINNYSIISKPALACGYDGVWHFIPTGDYPMGIYVGSDKFAIDVENDDLVYFNYITQKFELSDPENIDKGYMAIKGNSENIFMKGSLYKSATDIYTAGSYYYASTSELGKLTDTPNNFLVGVAIDTDKLLILNDNFGEGSSIRESSLGVLLSFFNM